MTTISLEFQFDKDELDWDDPDNFNHAFLALFDSGVSFHLSPERGLLPETTVPEPATLLLINMNSDEKAVVSSGSTLNLKGIIYCPMSEMEHSGGSSSKAREEVFIAAWKCKFTGPSFIKGFSTDLYGGGGGGGPVVLVE